MIFVEMVDFTDGMKWKNARIAKDSFHMLCEGKQAGNKISGAILSIQAQKLPSDIMLIIQVILVALKGWLRHIKHGSKVFKTISLILNKIMHQGILLNCVF